MYHEENNSVFLPATDEQLLRQNYGYGRPRPYGRPGFGYGAPFIGGVLGGLLGSALIRPYGYGYGYPYYPYYPYYGYGYNYGYPYYPYY